MSAPPFERARAFPRTIVRVSAEIDTGSERTTATTRDLSPGGVGLDLDRPLPEGRPILLSLFLVADDVEEERQEPLTVRGKTVWCAEAEGQSRYTAGIRFDPLAPPAKEWLLRFLALAK